MNINERLLEVLDDINHLMHFRVNRFAGQRKILVILYRSGVITQRDLTEILGTRPGSVSEILEKLERNGQIFRLPNEKDRRTADIYLTDEGFETAKKLDTDYTNEQDLLLSSLLPEEKEELIRILGKLRDDWNEQFPDHPKDKFKGHGGRNHPIHFKKHKKPKF